VSKGRDQSPGKRPSIGTVFVRYGFRSSVRLSIIGTLKEGHDTEHRGDETSEQ
jgi:hypothetical protein